MMSQSESSATSGNPAPPAADSDPELSAGEANYEFLVHAVEELRLRLELSEKPDDDVLTGELKDAREALEDARGRLSRGPALDVLVEVFGLNSFERDLVVLCMGFELDQRFGETYGEPSVALALARLPDAHWAAFAPQAPLRRWEVLQVEEKVALVDSRIRLSEDVMTYVLGLPMRSVPGDIFVVPPAQGTVLESQLEAAASLARAVRGIVDLQGWIPVVELHGAGVEERRLLAGVCSDLLGMRLDCVDVRDLPAPGADLEHVLRQWVREVALTPASLLVEVGDGEIDAGDRDRVRRVTGIVSSLVFVSGPAGVIGEPLRPVVRHEARYPDADERVRLWGDALVRSAERLGMSNAVDSLDVGALAEQYQFGSGTIDALCAAAEAEVATAAGEDGAPPASALLDALRSAARGRTRSELDALAERIELGDTEHLVLPKRERTQLDELELHIRYAYRVNTEWGMGRHHAGRGVSALFAGPSGTGKTLAAAVLARRLGLDIYRVELSAVMSKYIGETEKNLRKIFDAAASGGAILLFDEADALFGKRSDVKDSHDRYANLEIAYLLQKMEQARTPSILTTNLRESIDPAFQRRLRFVIEFPFPDVASREEMWRGVFPPTTPTRALVPERLATLAVNGGTIRNIALRAAFLAAREDAPIGMDHILEATKREFQKAGRDLPVSEVAGWAGGHED